MHVCDSCHYHSSGYSTMASKFILFSASLLVLVAVGVSGHGYMSDPCQRSSLWRLGFDTPINEEDAILNCGGFEVQWDQNDGKCGECGDAYNLERPRPNENGGTFGKGVIAREYTEGELITVMINLTMSHRGYFEYRLCPMNGIEGQPGTPVEQSCLDNHLLPLANGTTRWYLNSDSGGLYTMDIQLPKGITCDHCVMQWYWRTASNWGTCEDGSEGMGCGPQKTWSNCADIAIKPSRH